MIARVLACLLAVCVAVLAPAAGAEAANGHVQFRLADSRLDEISGIAAGIASPGVLYVENDGGDPARFFALDARTGRVRAVYTVPDAQNVDWEDIAVAPDSHGTPSVWLADIGDNDAGRRQVEIYRVAEPDVPTTAWNIAARAGRAEVWRLTYPDGPHDAESLAVSPAGVPYIVTKSLLGVSGVYAAPSTPGRSVLRRVGEIHFHTTGTRGPFAPVGQLTATGADVSRDGRLLVVRTYTDAYLWRVADGDLSSALQKAPTRLALPSQPQGEGICFSGDRLLIDSEQVRSAVYSVPLPPWVLRAPTSASTPTPTPVSTPAPSREAPSGRLAAHGTSASTRADGRGDGPTWGRWVGAATGAALVVIAAGAIGLARGRRRN